MILKHSLLNSKNNYEYIFSVVTCTISYVTGDKLLHTLNKALYKGIGFGN